ncbi:MAG: ABC transporter permease [Thermoleophilia bacterium]|nr:ABC transporter permease [Thermoleophilia bacterium]
MRLWAYTVRELWRRPGRTVLTVLGIVIGVAAVVSVSLASAGARDAFSNMFDQVAGRAALEVVAQARTPFDPAQAQAVESLPEVEAAVPAISVQAALLHGQERSPVLVLGIDPRVDGLVRDYVLREGALLSDETEVKADDLSDEAGAGAPVEALLEAGFARTLGLALGDEARLLTPTGLATLRVRGLLALRGAAVFNNGAVVVLPLERTQRLFDQEGRVNTVQLVLADGADVVAAQERVARVLPPGLIVQRPASRGGLADETLANTELGLSALSALALVAGAFIILNTFLMNVGERRRQLAVMRALGATRRQITRLLLREAILLGSGGRSWVWPPGRGSRRYSSDPCRVWWALTPPASR